MRIIHVSNFETKNDLAFAYHTARKLSFGLVRLGYAVFDFSDRDVARAEGILKHRKFGVGPTNRKLVNACRNIRPHLVLLGHADVIRPDTLAEIRAILPEVRIAQWNHDALFVPSNCVKIGRKLDVVDATFVTTAGDELRQFARPGKIAAYMPNPVDSSIESGRAFAEQAPRYDLFFSSRNPHARRMWDGIPTENEAIARQLRAALPGRRFALPGLPGNPHLYGMDYIEALGGSRIGLNLNIRNDGYLYASDRMGHMLGNGVLTTIDRVSGFDRMYREDEALFYSSAGELVERIRHFLEHDQELRETAERGWRRAHAMCDGARVAKYLVEQTMQVPLSEAYEWPTETY